MREIVGVFTHKEALEMLSDPAAAPPAAADEALRAEVIRSGTRARELQRQLTKEANRLVLDLVFSADLGRPAGERPRRRGTVVGVTPSRLYVQLDDPALDLKVYTPDLARQLGTELVCDEHEVVLRPASGGLRPLRLGDPVTLVVDGRDPDRDRWVFRLV
jgi:ribonuclease R